MVRRHGICGSGHQTLYVMVIFAGLTHMVSFAEGIPLSAYTVLDPPPEGGDAAVKCINSYITTLHKLPNSCISGR